MRTTTAVSMLAVAAVCLLPITGTQGDTSDGGSSSLYQHVEACQKVVRKHILLAENTITSALSQVGETNATMQAYVKLWGDRVVAGANDEPSVTVLVRSCEDDFDKALRAIAASLETKLRDSLAQQVQWYDQKIYSLFSDVLSEASQDGVVEAVKTHMEPILKVFDNEAVTAVKQSIKDMSPAYQKVSKCIREQSLAH